MTENRVGAPERAIAIAALFGAELIHTMLIPSHVREWWAAGWFFLLVSVLEGVVASALLFAPSRPATRAAVGLSAATAVVWLVSRSVGVPFGPFAWVREPVSTVDVAATVLELTTIAALVAGRVGFRLRVARRAMAAGLAAVVTITGLGLAAAPAAIAAHAGRPGVAGH